MSYWLSVDTDDRCHLPSKRGHPHRSSLKMPHWRTEGYRASSELLNATDRFIEWVRNGPQVTIFLIAEQLDCPEFTSRMELLRNFENITFACHGWGHRCWAAWPIDTTGFSEMLTAARNRISTFAGSSWRPWFRAPAGYIAPWMAAPLAATGFELDSSINPSRWVARKMGGDWNAVMTAIEDMGLVERPWLTTWIGPACGPALSLFPFSLLARKAWLQSSKGRELNPVENDVITLYWHLLDHGRKRGLWQPPIHTT